MFVVHGMYHWKKQRTAYRGDYCLTCECPRIALQIRSFDVGHLYFIPLLPLGYRPHWYCTACGRNPHVRTRTSRGLLILFAFLLVLVMGMAWLGAPLVPRSDAGFIWGMRLVPLALIAAIVAWLSKTPATPGLQELLRMVPPVSVDQCLYCGGSLDRDGYCVACKLRRMQLDASFSLQR